MQREPSTAKSSDDAQKVKFASRIPALPSWFWTFRERFTWILLANVVASALLAATTLWLARQLGAEEFGRFSLTYTVASLLMAVLLVGTNFSMYRYLPVARDYRRSKFMTNALFIVSCLLLSLGVLNYFFGAVVASLIGVEPQLWTFAVAFMTSFGAYTLTEAFLRGLQQFRLISVLRVIMSVAGFALIIAWFLLLREDTRYYHYIAVLGGSQLLIALFIMLRLRSFLQPSKLSFRYAKIVFYYGFTLMASQFAIIVIFSFDTIFLNLFTSPEEVGLFSAYNSFAKRLLLIVFTDGVAIFLLPLLAKNNMNDVFGQVKRYVIPLIVIVGAIAGVGIVVVFWLLGDDYDLYGWYAFLTSVGIALHALFNLFYSIFTMEGQRGARLSTYLLAGAVPISLLVQYGLIRGYGIAGGMWAFIVNNLLIIVGYWFLAKVIFTPDFKKKLL